MAGNSYKAQWKNSANGAWQTKLSGTEQSCLAELSRLRDKYPFAQVVDSSGRVVA